MIYLRTILSGLATVAVTATLCAQQSSSSSEVRRLDRIPVPAEKSLPGVSERMHLLLTDDRPDDDNAQWLRVVYRSLDADEIKNAALYYPEDVVDGKENLFRILMRLVAAGDMNAYEYLDGRELFTDDYRLSVSDLLNRFYIPYTEARPVPGRAPAYEIAESDVPVSEILSYYIIERWEFDRRSNRKTMRVEALCPVLHRTDDFGGEAVRYPMFWVKMDDLRPHLLSQHIFVDDSNNAEAYTYDDFFRMGLYKGEIYKTRNLRNKSMIQLYPDTGERRRAQAAVDSTLENYEKKMWVPTREEVIAAREERERLGQADSITVSKSPQAVKKKTAQATRSKRATRTKSPKAKESKTVTRSVRARK